MAPSLVSTLGGTTSNSYQSVADAGVYFANTLFAAEWTALTADTKAAALITATQWLETLTYTGTRVATTQALQWPREATSASGTTNDGTTIPREVLAAQAELALALATTPTALTGETGSTTTTGPVKRQKLDALEIEYFTPWAPDTGALLQRFRWLRPLIAPWLTNSSPQLVGRVRS
jgi:hypothetical protein